MSCTTALHQHNRNLLRNLCYGAVGATALFAAMAAGAQTGDTTAPPAMTTAAITSTAATASSAAATGSVTATGATAATGSVAATGVAAATTNQSAAIPTATDVLNQQMPAGFVFVYDFDGSLTTHLGDQPLQMERHQLLSLDQPLGLHLGRNSSVALVLSNGVAIWAKGPARFTIRQFEQQPFVGNSRSQPYEPTTSRLEIDLAEGTFSFAERSLSALSRMHIRFGANNILDANEATSFIMQVVAGKSSNSDRISILSGRALLHYGGRSSAMLIGNGQYLELQRNNADLSLQLPSQLTTDQFNTAREFANNAQAINSRVWFTREAPDDAPQAQIILPANFWLSKPHEATRIR